MGKTALQQARWSLGAFVANAALTVVPALSRKAPPWQRINVSGSGAAYIASGEGVIANLFKEGLREGHNVAEIGCGIGGNPVALWRRAGDRVNYRGFDIVAFAITWCRQHFRQLGSGYEFVRSNIFNTSYNRSGRIRAQDYRFPYDDAWADVIFANSVFTHMQEPEVVRYFQESARVVKPGGFVWFTFFLLDEASEAQIASGEAAHTFRHQRGAARIVDADEPDAAVAYPAHWIEALLSEAGFTVRKVERSRWRGIEAADYQDIVVAVRT